MAGSLNRQRRNRASFVLANTFVNDILVATHIAQMFEAQFLFEEDGQFITGNGVRDNRAARIIRCQNSCHHRNQGIAADFLAVFEDGAHTVNIRIEDKTEVCTAVQHSFFDSCHSLLVFRIGNMVGEIPVRL